MFLGTSGSTPTAQRAPSATLVRRGGERLLIDCAEGTQRQLLRSTVGLAELREVFLTHYHADHYLGLPGMLKTFALRGRELPITIYGPAGLRDLFGALKRIFGRLTFAYELVELGPGDVLDRDGYRLLAFPVEHGAAGLGYAVVEETRAGRFDVATAVALGGTAAPARGALLRGESVTLTDGRTVMPQEVLGPPRAGRKLVFTGDTRPSPVVVEVARGADVLVHEATFGEEERERAGETAHSTATDAAEVARDAEVALLALTHLSNRYFGPEILREARAVFAETVVPKDFDVIEVPFPERGTPRLLRRAARPPRRQADVREDALAAPVAIGEDTSR